MYTTDKFEKHYKEIKYNYQIVNKIKKLKVNMIVS